MAKIKVQIEQKSLDSKRKRIKLALRRLFSHRFVRSQKTYLTVVSGQKLKRLVLKDSYLAARIASNLEAFSSCGIFPELVGVYENEVWVEFVEGNPLDGIETSYAVIDQIVQFYVTLYTRAPRKVAVTESGFARSAHKNLRFLNGLGILTDGVCRRLDSKLHETTPEHVWIGYDYTDPFFTNFLMTAEDTLVAIDVESIFGDYLLGSGIAKARAIWPAQYGEYLWQKATKLSSPDFGSYYPFVEISYLAEWMKRSVLHEKWGLVNPSYFDKVE